MHYKRVLRPKASSLTLVSYSYQETKVRSEKQWGNKTHVFAQILPGKNGLVWPATPKHFGKILHFLVLH